jgi:hypothetical protein
MNLPQLAQFKRIVVKVGSSLLVDRARGEVKRDWLHGLTDDLASLHRRGADVLVVSSGAVALGRSVLGLPGGVLKLEDRLPPPSARSRWRAFGPKRLRSERSSPARFSSRSATPRSGGAISTPAKRSNALWFYARFP